MTIEDRETRRGEVRVHRWQWGPDERQRPGLPWVGIFLVVFGALLLLERFVPQFRLAGSALLLAIGIVFLARWAIERGGAALYAGAIITGLALPGLLQGSGIVAGPGLGTLCLGLAFLFIALVRYQTGGGVGWQAWFGAILAVIGGTQVALPQLGGLLVPALLVAFGLLLVFGGMLPGRRSP
ncbi:MAG TPA: hypothetical protein VM344_03710 [Vitreimonas sp.]|nr:hypothetical protein [Vitreimonas sp.]